MIRILNAGALIIFLAVGAAFWSKGAIPLRGTVAEGSRFRVSIGEPYDKAQTSLQSQGYRLFASEMGGLCVFKRFDTTHTVRAFAVPGWPTGTVCVVEHGGKVSEVVWAFELTNGFL